MLTNLHIYFNSGLSYSHLYKPLPIQDSGSRTAGSPTHRLVCVKNLPQMETEITD